MSLFGKKQSYLQGVFNQASSLYEALDALEKATNGKFKVVETRAFVTDKRDLAVFKKLAEQTGRKINIIDAIDKKDHLLDGNGFLCIETNIPEAGLDKQVKLLLKKDFVEAYGTVNSQIAGHPSITVRNINHPSSVKLVVNYVRDKAQHHGMI